MFADVTPPLVDVTPPPVESPPLESGDPTWYLVWDLVLSGLAAVGTVAAVVVAVVLAGQAAKDQRAQRNERERAQAERVTLARDTTVNSRLVLRNDSELPITRIRIVSVGARVDDLHPVAPQLAPGKVKTFAYEGVKADTVAVAEFSDAAGYTWIRTADNHLFRVYRRFDESALTFDYGPDQPGGKAVEKIYVQRVPGGHRGPITARAMQLHPNDFVPDRHPTILGEAWAHTRDIFADAFRILTGR